MANIGEKLPRLPFDSFKDQLDSLLIAVPNLLERQWPIGKLDHPSSSILLQQFVRVSANTYETLRFFCADNITDASWKLEYTLCAPVLARLILEAVFATVFIFEDLPKRTEWFEKAGWREMAEESARHEAAYSGDPSWESYLKQGRVLLQALRAGLNVTAEEAANPEIIPYWPIPGRMLKDKSTSKDRTDFMTYLNDWFYRSFSQEAHLSWPGLVRLSAGLLPAPDYEQRQWNMKKHKSDVLASVVILLLSLLSEIEIELNFDLKPRLRYIWGLINPMFPVGKEVYERRYAGRI